MSILAVAVIYPKEIVSYQNNYDFYSNVYSLITLFNKIKFLLNDQKILELRFTFLSRFRLRSLAVVDLTKYSYSKGVNYYCLYY